MGQLWDLVQAYIDRHGTSERQLAKRLGYASSAGYLPEPRVTDEAIQLRRTPSGTRTRGQQRALDFSVGEESQDPDRA